MYSLQIVNIITKQSIKNGVHRFYAGFTWKINPLKPSHRLKNF